MSDTARKTVLVVEDSALSREKIVSIVAELGCEVLAATDGLEGVKVAKEQATRLDLVVLDIQMPRMDGITALRYMRQMPEMASVPIVMLTTQVDTETVRTALTYKATDFIRKDASIPKITERLKGYLDGTGPGSRPAQSSESEAQAASAILQGSRRHHPQNDGPYVLIYEALTDIQTMEQGRDRGLLRFYQRLQRAVQTASRQHPGLGLGYTIEHDSKEVTRLAKGDVDAVRLVLVSGRRADGLSLARMVRFLRQDGPPVLVVCDAIAALPLEERESLARSGAELIERGKVDDERLQAVVDEHLVPPPQVTPSGLRYYELSLGEGSLPQPGQQVTVHYTAMLVDGTVFEDTRKRGIPHQFILGQNAAVPGWEEGIARMKPKGRAVFVVPPELAYGAQGHGAKVPPEATLVYNTELISLGKAPRPDILVP